MFPIFRYSHPQSWQVLPCQASRDDLLQMEEAQRPRRPLVVRRYFLTPKRVFVLIKHLSFSERLAFVPRDLRRESRTGVRMPPLFRVYVSCVCPASVHVTSLSVFHDIDGFIVEQIIVLCTLEDI